MQKPLIPTDVEVLGQAIMAVVGGMDFVKARAMKILADNGLPEIEPQRWYPLRNAIAAYHTIYERIGPSTLRSVGRKVPEHAKFPPDIRTLQAALEAIDKAYQMNHRGQRGGNIGGYRFEPVSERGARMLCDNPYPCDFDKGIIEALCERFQPKESMWVRVEHDVQHCRLSGGAACVYHITW